MLDTLRPPFDTATDLFFGEILMKLKPFSGKKTSKKKDVPYSETPDSESEFYTKNVGEAPLNEFSAGHGRTVRRTSHHSPARRRETSNRASNREILLLLFRTGLIVFLLLAGFFALRLVLEKLEEPSEKERQQWAVNEELREKSSITDVRSLETTPADTPVLSLNAEVIGMRLQRWAEAERYMRSAEALNHRGINEEAILRLGQVLRVAPDNYAAQRLLMEIHMRSGNYAEVVSLCVRLLDQNSLQWEVKMDLLQALKMLDQKEACLVLANQMLEKEPNNLEVLGIASFAQRAVGNPEGALVLFDQMLLNDKQNPTALAGCGSIYMDRGEWQKATPYYLELVKTAPNLENYHELVRCYALQAEAGKAVMSMGQAASLFGESGVSSWLRDDITAFDSIRETVEYRSFADRLVGEDTRKAIEEIGRREVEKKADEGSDGLELPTQPELQLKPRPRL